MSDAPDVFASPGTIELGGRTFVARPLGMADWGELERAARKHYRQELVRGIEDLRDVLSDEEYKAKRSEAIDKAQQCTSLPVRRGLFPVLENGEVKRSSNGDVLTKEQTMGYTQWWMVNTREGMVYMIWTVLRQDATDLTLEKVGELVNQLGDEEIRRKADEIADVSGGTPGNPGGRPGQTVRAAEQNQVTSSGTPGTPES